MKSISKQCPNGYGAMHRCHIMQTVEGKRCWNAISWQYCTDGKMMLVDEG